MENQTENRRTSSMAWRAIAISCIAFLITEKDAQAYLDPGAGSFATQILIAGAAGFAFSLRSFLARFVRLRKSSRK